jgi:hypothetical protein
MPRPIFMLVSGDARRLDALRHDLSRRYEADYQVCVASSAAAALTMLAVLAGARAEVALVIADEYLADMPAVDFLARAHSLHAGAKRILLIYHGDWSPENPAVLAIAVGKIDYHLYGPWTLGGLGGGVLLRRERGDKLGSGVNVELAIDLPQVELDRLGRQEQVGRDVTVRRSAPHRRDHAPFLRRERAIVVLRQPVAPAGRTQLGLGLAGPGARVQPFESFQCGPQVLTGRCPPAGPVQAAPVRQQRTSPLERHGPPVVERERAGEGRVEVVVEQTAAAGRRGGGHRTGAADRLAFEPGQHAAGVALPALAGIGLDEIRNPRDDHRLLVP